MMLARPLDASKKRLSYRVRVESCIPGDFGIFEQMRVSIRWYWWRLGSRRARVVTVDVLVEDMHIAVRCNGCYREHERLFGSHSVVKEAMRFRRDDVCGVLTLVGHGRVVVSLECCIDILVSEWVEQEV